MNETLRTTLRAERERRGWSQARMAVAGGISRQSYAAIESGKAVPSTEVALRFARSLGRSVETLFTLADQERPTTRGAWAGATPAREGQAVRLSRVGGRAVVHPAGEAYRPARASDGVVLRVMGEEVEVRLLEERPPSPDLVVVGCDPAFGLVAEVLRRERGVEVHWSPRGSRAALDDLASGRAHVAGTHLLHRPSGEWNGPWVRERVPFKATRIGFAVWDQGLVMRPSGPGLREVGDLARAGVRIVNREEGSGSRMLLDEELAVAGVDPSGLKGYHTRARSHEAVAEGVAAGVVDTGVATRATASAMGLDFLPLRQERYELVVPDHLLDLPSVQALLDVLARPGVRAQVEALPGYDGDVMGRATS